MRFTVASAVVDDMVAQVGLDLDLDTFVVFAAVDELGLDVGVAVVGVSCAVFVGKGSVEEFDLSASAKVLALGDQLAAGTVVVAVSPALKLSRASALWRTVEVL
jgi:hypothetical protein